MDKFDLKGTVFQKVWPDFASRRRVLRQLVAQRNNFDKYDKAFAKAVKAKQRLIDAGIFGSAVMGGGLMMIFTQFLHSQGFAQGFSKMLVFWSVSWVVSDIMQVEVVLKREREKVMQLAAKYRLDESA